MSTSLHRNAEKIQAILNEYGLDLQVREFKESTRTSAEAAEAVGCELGQIAKSIIFKGNSSQKPICVIASGVNRVDEKKIRAIMGEKIKKADADYVLAHTGYPIGGVPPVGHSIPTLIDPDLMNHDEIWAAAGTPHAVFKLTPQQLLDLTRGRVVDVKQD